MTEQIPAGGVASPEAPEPDPRVESTEPSPQLSAVEPSERRALVVGEALIDVVRSDGETIGRHPGGSPMNVAIGLARLGRGVDLLTWFGKDADGAAITAHLSSSGVAVVPGSDSAARTSVAVADLDPAGVARYEFDLSWEVPSTWASPAVAPLVVHTGSIAAVLEPGGPDVAHILAAHRTTATVTYDPNMRPSLMAPAPQTRPLVEHLVLLSDVVKVSDEDLDWLEPGSEPTEVARRWAGLGPAAVIVTRGGQGAVAVTSSGLLIEVPSLPVVVADTVGAGDSFMSGLIDGLWSAGLLGAEHREELHGAGREVWTRVLERCARIAALTVSRPGANPPTAAELDG